MKSIIESVPYLSKIKKDSITAKNFTVCGSHSCLFWINKLPWLWFLTRPDVADASINSGPGVNCNFSVPFTEQSCVVGHRSATLYAMRINSYILVEDNVQLSYSNTSFSLLPLLFKQTFRPQCCEYKVAAAAFVRYLLHKVHAENPL